MKIHDQDVKVPVGKFTITAGKLMDEWYVEGSLDLDFGSAKKYDEIIILKDTPEFFREVTLRGTMNIKDEESFLEDDEFATRTFFQNGIMLGPFGTHAETSWTEAMGGEICVEVYLKLDWKVDSSVDISYNVKLFEGTSEDTHDLDGEKSGVVNVLKGTTHDLRVFVSNTEEDDDDPVELSMLVSNDRRA